MKHIALYLTCIIIALGTNMNCTKGPSGPQGPAGATGPAGANGEVIFSGNGAPTTAIGNTGDFYLDLSSGLLYGPKTASGWGSGFSLKGSSGAAGPAGPAGPAGAAGAAGSKIYNGSGAPGSSLGAVGDYYLDVTSYELYGPKTNAGWGTAVSLKGPAGTANVIFSDWNYATNFRDTVIDASQLNVADLAAPSLTLFDVQNGTLELYFTYGAGIFPLPYTSNAGGKGNTIDFIPQVGNILITRFTFDNSGSVLLGSQLQYRFVIIPGAVGVPNYLDYHATMRYLRVPEN